MFTGLVQHVGQIVGAEPTASGVRIRVDPRGWSHAPSRGDSICVSGVCLTVLDAEPGAWAFDVVPQTLALTTLGRPGVTGRPVNLEHAVLASTPLGGHLVQGHVDGVGRVAGVTNDGAVRLRIDLPGDMGHAVLAQGSIAIDGVSLTVAAASKDGSWIEVALIPETLSRTTLGRLAVGDEVNVEVDHLAKLIAREVARRLTQR